MKYTRQEKQKGKVKIEFEVSAKEWEDSVEAAYQKEKGKYKKEGFRQGRVPRKVLESTYGESVFYEEAFNILFPRVYVEMLEKEKDLEPVDFPEIDVSKVGKDGAKFVAIVTVVPDVTLGKCKGLEVKVSKATVTAEEINKELESLQQRNARYVEIKDRAVKLGDLVNLDYSGSVDGKKFQGGTAQDQELEIGSKAFIDGFETQMIGMKIGEEKALNVVFPENYGSKELAGKPAIFDVKVLGIREKQVPNLDDSFAKDVSEFETLEELKKDYKKKMLDKKEENNQRIAENKLVELIVKDSKVEVPDCMVEKQTDYMVQDFAQRLAMSGLRFEDYLKYAKQTEMQYRESLKVDAKRSVETNLVLDQIVKLNKIEATEEEVFAKYEELTKDAPKSQKTSKKNISEEQQRSIKNRIIAEKTIEFLKNNNKFVKGEAK